MPEARTPKPGLLSFREKRIIRYAIFFVIISRLLLMFRSEERIYTRPYLEDSYYLFNCAEHFAHGEGFTCDGKQPTNGVQPLIVILYAPLFLIAGSSKLLALRLGFFLIAIFDSFSIVFLTRLIRLLQKKPIEENSPWKSPPVIAAILWATLYPIFVHTGGGLETGLYSTMLIASLYCYTKLTRIREAGGGVGILQWISFGIILGFTVLSRIDSVFFVAALAGYEFYRFKGKGFVSGAIISVTAFVVSSPWWFYNLRIFGSLMPQSGSSESMGSVIGENMLRSTSVIADILMFFFFTPYYDLPVWTILLLTIAIFFVVLGVVRKLKLRDTLGNKYSLDILTPYLLFCGGITIYYLLFFSAPHFLPRYLHPLRIYFLLLFSCATPMLLEAIDNFYRRSKASSILTIGIFSLAALGFSGVSYLRNFTTSKDNDFYLIGEFALEHPREKIGMEQSGTAGFIAANIVNLDGKVNFEALQAKKRGDIGEYIEKEHLDYIADWREFSEPMVASAAKHGGKFQEMDSIGRVIIFRRVK
ncbi:MAG: hypothetical protein ABI778_01685 [Ignavibacteriota bacterium]